ncbi:UNVERIFIED_CONTAM: hypothetical protein BEN50_13740 [Euhalothece sp. KZN 001]
MVSQSPYPSKIETLQAEVNQLKGELQLRDQLVEQLSQELFRLVKDNPNFTSVSESTEEHRSQLELLNNQIAEIEEQLQFYQQQISTRNTEIAQLQTKIRTLTERNQALEEMLQDLPEVYRQKFSQRMKPVKEKVEQLKEENQQLQAKVQSLTYRLAVRNRGKNDPDIEQWSQQAPSV